MNSDYPYKITRQDKNLSEVEYVQVCNNAEGRAYGSIESNRQVRPDAANGCEVKPVAWASTDDDGHVELHLLKQKAIATGLRVFPLYAAPLSPEKIQQIIEALQLGKLVIDASENSWDAFDLIGSAIKLLESRL